MTWPTATLDELCEINVGRTPARANPVYWGSGEPWLSIADMSQGREITRTKEQITPAGASGGRRVAPGTVLLSFKLSIGKVARAGIPLYTNEAIAALPIKRGNLITADFLMRALEHADLTGGSNRAAMGATLNKATLKEVEVPVPPLPEQRRIAAILDHADALRAKRRQVLTQLDVLAQALYEHMIGSRDWPLTKIGAISSKVGSGATPRGGQSAYKTEGVALIRSMNVHDGKFKWKDLAFLDDQQAAALSNVVVEADDVLLNITGASVARVSRAPASALPARVNQHVAIIRPTPGTVQPRILERHLISARTKRELLNVAGGGATREAITKAQILELEVPVPDSSAQASYLAAASVLDEQQQAAKTAIESADQLFASLQSRAFRGDL